MPVKFEIDYSEVRNFFNDMKKRAQKPEAVMDIVAVKGWRDVVEHFKAEEDEDRKRWQPLKKPRKRGGGKILQDTGLLRMSTGYRSKGDEAQIYNNRNYARTHNEGDAKRNIPKRQFLWISDIARLSIFKTLLRYIKDGKIDVS